MTEEESFVPRTDEELARLLEEQLSQLRQNPEQATQIPESVSPVESAPAVDFSPQDLPEWNEGEDENGIDSLFGALLEPAEVTDEVSTISEDQAPEVFDEFLSAPHEAPQEPPAVTEPYDYSQELEPEILGQQEVVQSVGVVQISSSDATDGIADKTIIATTISATAGPEPIPAMFGDADYISAVMEAQEVPFISAEISDVIIAEEAVSVVQGSDLFSEVSLDNEDDVSSEMGSEKPEPGIANENTLSSDDNKDYIVAPITSFHKRPSFDELVFGGASED